MQKRIGLVIALVTLQQPVAGAQVTSGDCSDVLVETVRHEQQSLQQSLAWLHLVNETNFNQAKQSASAALLLPAVPLLFSGDYSRFSDARRQLYAEYRYTWNQQQAAAYVTSFLPDAAIQAWSNCKRAQAIRTNGLSAWIRRATDQFVVVSLTYNVAGGGQGRMSQIDVRGIPESQRPRRRDSTYTSGSEWYMQFDRITGQDFVFNAVIGGTQAEVFLPWAALPPPDTASLLYRRFLSGRSERWIYLSPGQENLIGGTIAGNQMRFTLDGYWHGRGRCKGIVGGHATDFDGGLPDDSGLAGEYAFVSLQNDGTLQEPAWVLYAGGEVSVPSNVLVLVRARVPRPGGGCFHNPAQAHLTGHTPAPAFAHVMIRN